MAPLPLPPAPSISSSARAVSSSFSRRSITPPSTLLSRLGRTAESAMPSRALLSRAVGHIKRQSSGIVAIPTTYQGLNSGPAPGTVAGITIGAVAGFLLVIYVIYTAFTLTGRRTVHVDEEIIHRHHSVSPPPRRTRSRRHRSSRAHSEEVVEVRERSRPRRTSERIIVEERTRSVAPAPPPPQDDDDIVEVIEEHSPPRRHKSRRESGFRTVDPAEFGGGGRPMRKIRR